MEGHPIESSNVRAAIDNVIRLVETVDTDALGWILENIETFIVKEERKKFKKYAKRIKDGQITVEYNQINGFGRLYARKALSLQGFSRHVRARLSAQIYHDIDMENCHPVFLLGLCEQHGWNAPELRNYVEHREDVLKIVDPLDRSEAKLIMLSLMYGSKMERANGIPLCQRYKQEMHRIARLIYNRYPLIVHNARNPYFSRMSLLLQNIEHTVLMEMAKFFRYSGYQIGVYVFDGIMIYRKAPGPLAGELLRGCEMHIRESTGWDIALSEKVG